MKSLRLFLLNLAQFCIIAANMRAIAQGLYLWAFITDAAICLLGFAITKQIVESGGWKEKISYSLGGALGAQLAILGTRWIWGT